jgi:hypothetical protein
MTDHFTIEFHENGIRLTEKLYPVFKLWAWLQGKSGTNINEMNWSEVERVFVYKNDVYTFDVICMAFVSESGRVLEINEQMRGWKYQIEDLPNCLPGCKPFAEWFMDVAFPAFEMNMTEIYKK